MNQTNLDNLLDAYLDGMLGDDDRAALEQHLLQSDDARRQFWQATQLHAAAREVCLTRQGIDASQGDIKPPQRRFQVSSFKFQILAAAAVIALAITGWFFYQLETRNPKLETTTASSPSLALLTDQQDAVWEDGARAQVGESLPAGSLSLRRGTAQLMLNSGAVVTLHGPAEFELLADNAAAVHRGMLIAWVPPRAHGFTVTTPTAAVTDLGTEFGIRVHDTTLSEIHVFDGSVHVASSTNRNQITLRAGQALAMGPDPRNLESAVHRTSMAQFMQRIRRTLDLSDVLAGGDGFSDATARGIETNTGRPTDSFNLSSRSVSPTRFNPVAHALIDGVFIPDGPTPIDSAGQTRFDFGNTSGNILSTIYTFRPGDERYENLNMSRFCPDRRGVIYMHTNAGITFDLHALRQANPDDRITRLRTVAANVEDVNGIDPRDNEHVSVDLWVLVDGETRFVKKNVNSRDGGFHVDLELSDDDRFVTLAASDAGNGFAYDWVVFGDPVLEMTSDHQHKIDTQQRDKQE